nr:GNAT family N-acetyltransferase [Cryptosporangium aurantiacum]
MAWELAQVNVGRLRAPLDSPVLADFMAALDPINAAADAAPGFRWRLATDEGNATAIRAFEWDAADSVGVIVNMSVWDSVESLSDFTFGELHRTVLRRRREWFAPMSEAYTALWWVPAGERPTTEEAEERVRHLRKHGPTETAFTFRAPFPPPEFTLRPGADTDVRTIAEIWHDGWADAHLGRVPDALLAHRTFEDLVRRVPIRLDVTTVATVDEQVVGFAVAHDDELEQLYVSTAARGSGVATALLRHAERVIAANHRRAWLAVVDGNRRARRFYERCGWYDGGPFDYRAFTEDGTTVAVPCRRYVRDLG